MKIQINPMHYFVYQPKRNRKMKLVITSYLLINLVLVSIDASAASPKIIVGATEVIFIEEANLNFKARVDTGAKTSSIHAERIKVSSFGDAEGKPISFYLVTKQGQSVKIETHVTSVVKVKTSAQSEHRYVVPLIMKWKDSQKTVLVTLNDRKNMNYRLLLGRNWLHGEFIVDVDLNDED